LSAARANATSSRAQGIVFLDLPYEENEEAKKLGADFGLKLSDQMWEDGQPLKRKKWFVKEGMELEPFSRWLECERTYLTSHFTDKEAIKLAGGWEKKDGPADVVEWVNRTRDVNYDGVSARWWVRGGVDLHKTVAALIRRAGLSRGRSLSRPLVLTLWLPATTSRIRQGRSSLLTPRSGQCTHSAACRQARSGSHSPLSLL